MSMYNQHLNGGTIPAEIADSLMEFLPEDGDLSYEELLLQQETIYSSIQAIERENAPYSCEEQSGSRSQLPAQASEPSSVLDDESQLALDEALARSLQEFNDDFEDLHISEQTSIVTESRESTPRATPARAESHNFRQDELDPDNMTYEELQFLGDAVGQESRGLSDDAISRLPAFKYKVGFFSRNREKKECVICQVPYKNGAKLITLPCAHQYHADCITRWLKEKKTCPFCMKDVLID